MTFECLVHLSLYLQNYPASHELFPLELRLYTRPIQKLSTIRHRLHSSDEVKAYWETLPKWTLLSLVLKTTYFYSSDPRGRVYAMSGLLDNEDHCVPQNVVADYTMPYRELIISIVAYALTQQGDFTTLDYAQPEGFPGWPSWVPEINRELAYPSQLVYESRQYHAALKQEVAVQERDGRLIARVTKVGKVCSLCILKGWPRRLQPQNEFTTVESVDFWKRMEHYRIFKEFVCANNCDSLPAPEQLVRAWSRDPWTHLKRFSRATDEDQASWIRILNNDEERSQWFELMAKSSTGKHLSSMSYLMAKGLGQNVEHVSWMSTLTFHILVQENCYAGCLRVGYSEMRFS